VSREDKEAPRALTICAPITTAYRGSKYEVDIGKPHFLPLKSYVNVQGLQAIQHHEMIGPVGRLEEARMEAIFAAVKYTFGF
jgi:mRNA-degrading endonuclease toxin of MazEF toxin-antitoxin module